MPRQFLTLTIRGGTASDCLLLCLLQYSNFALVVGVPFILKAGKALDESKVKSLLLSSLCFYKNTAFTF
jgi:hypothetical protein